jgi:biotin synthase-like enzyme
MIRMKKGSTKLNNFLLYQSDEIKREKTFQAARVTTQAVDMETVTMNTATNVTTTNVTTTHSTLISTLTAANNDNQ